jgi:hypothetical protein
MRITKGQIVAGYPALEVRGFLRRYRLGAFIAGAAEEALKISSREEAKFLREMLSLGYLEPVNPPSADGTPCFEVTSQGQAFANASGAKPISRETADRVLQDFMQRVQVVNANDEFVYKIESVVLFGSMLAELDRLGDVDLAIELQPRAPDAREFQDQCQSRRRLAMEKGRRFGSTFDWAVWPNTEIFLFLKSRSRSLSLHALSEVQEMKGVRYRVLQGSPDRLAAMIPAGTPVSHHVKAGEARI